MPELKNIKHIKIDDHHLRETADVEIEKTYNWRGICSLEEKLLEDLERVQTIKAKMVELGIGE